MAKSYSTLFDEVIMKKLLLIGLILLCSSVTRAQKHRQAPASQREHFIDSLINNMTLQEKIGQLNLLSSNMAITGETLAKGLLKDIKDGKVGAVFNAYTPTYLKKLQDAAVKHSRLHIPLMFGFDVIHGYKTIFPIPLAMASSWDTTAIKRAAQIAAKEASADGLNWVFSPMVDISRDPRWGRVMEGSGEDPWLGSQIAKAYVHGYQGTNLAADTTVLATVKHFALYGASEAGRDYNTVDMSRHKMYQYYFPPYKAAIDAGVGSVMTSFNTVNGIPAAINKWLLVDILRKKWGFKGMVVSDFGALGGLYAYAHGVAADSMQVAQEALTSQTDMDMMGMAYSTQLKKLVNQKRVTEKAINQAVRRVLTAKYNLGLFDNPYKYIDKERAKKDMMTPENLRFARKMARKSIVLLKNDKKLLPLKKEGTIAIIGPLAKDKHDIIGSWWGTGDWHKAISIYQGIKEAVEENVKLRYAKGANITDDTIMLRKLNNWGGQIKLSNKSPQALIAEAVKTAQQADVVIMCLGESQGMSGEAASRSDIRLPKNQLKLLKAVYKTSKPIVLLLSNGRPLVLTWADRHIPSIVETWFPGTEGGRAIADVLFGKYNPSGKLTMSFPRTVGQIPIYYNHLATGHPFERHNKYSTRYLDVPNESLYPFGYGLSYTHFSYDKLTLNKTEITPNEKLKVSVTLTNDGAYAGEETVQLYFRDIVARISQPVKRLCDFHKVFLKPGEQKTVHFTLSINDLKYYNTQGKRIYDPGVFKLFVGGSSAKTLSTQFTLKATH